MIIGVPREIKVHEYRVGLLPAGVEEFKNLGHQVLVETHAGDGCGFSDEDYAAAEAEIVSTPQAVYARAELVVKVKEPQANEIRMLRPGQIVFTFFHFCGGP